MSQALYSLARQGVFFTVQGEGVLSGVPMIFVRFAGCRVGCGVTCDTDFRPHSEVSLSELMDRISRLYYGSVEWVWLTGGEPTEQDVAPLAEAARCKGLKVALATAGVRATTVGDFDFVSVSPHSLGDEWVQREGDQVVCVPGLKGLTLGQMSAADFSGFPPGRRYVSPLADGGGTPSNVKECVEWLMTRKGWRLNCQAHKAWSLA